MPKDRLVIKTVRKSDHAACGRGLRLRGGETCGGLTGTCMATWDDVSVCFRVCAVLSQHAESFLKSDELGVGQTRKDAFVVSPRCGGPLRLACNKVVAHFSA